MTSVCAQSAHRPSSFLRSRDLVFALSGAAVFQRLSLRTTADCVPHPLSSLIPPGPHIPSAFWQTPTNFAESNQGHHFGFRLNDAHPLGRSRTNACPGIRIAAYLGGGRFMSMKLCTDLLSVGSVSVQVGRRGYGDNVMNLSRQLVEHWTSNIQIHTTFSSNKCKGTPRRKQAQTLNWIDTCPPGD